MKGSGITVLSILEEEHHEKRCYRGAGVDDKLPRIREVEEDTSQPPVAQAMPNAQDEPSAFDAWRAMLAKLKCPASFST